MSKKPYVHSEDYFANLRYDLPSGIVIFLVAVPLCLGIALASGASFFSGIIAGVIGGLIVPLISRAQLSVSGPAAGLTAIVFWGIQDVGSFEAFLVVIFLAGVLQIIFGLLKVGFISYYVPSTVIRGMLAAIGITLILKQLPHAIGYDVEIFEDDKFLVTDQENTFTLLLHALENIEWGALVISSISISILILWEKSRLSRFYWIPSALFIVILGVLFNVMFHHFVPFLELSGKHLVQLPQVNNIQDFLNGFVFPDWQSIGEKKIWIHALTVGLIASIETLLTIKALEKIDPFKRKSPLNRELIAQGVGNMVAGLLGGLPVTSVIVRSSVGINAGAKTKIAVLFHGALLLLAIIFISPLLNQIPLACLSAILLLVGYKLAQPSLIQQIYKAGNNQFIPFVITILAILFTDLLQGVAIGIIAGLFFILRTNIRTPFSITKDGKNILLRFNKDVYFMNKVALIKTLEEIEEGSTVIVDGKRASFIDHDVLEILEEFREEAKIRQISVEFKNVKPAENE